MKYSRQEIIIIGGEGYIGSTLSDFFLKKNFFVRSIDNLIYNQKKPIKKKILNLIIWIFLK